MITTFTERLNAVDATILTPLVRQAMADDKAEVLTWHYQPMSGGRTKAMGTSYGLYRFQGQARSRDRDAVYPWSLVLKATGADAVKTGSESGVSNARPGDTQYWKREVLLHQSDLLANLPEGLVAARCYAVTEYPGQEFWIWLEDIEDSDWSLETYGLAARHLGQFNGAYLTGRPLPQADWLTRGRARNWLAIGEAGLAAIQPLSQHPLNQQWLRDDSLARMRKLRTYCDRLLTALERLPRTFCHHDAFRCNLMSRRKAHGQNGQMGQPGQHSQIETVAIDWALAGTGAIGEELATMIFLSVVWEVEPERIKEFEAIVMDNYLAGLAEAGWRGDPQQVRFAYAATIALSFGLGAAGAALGSMPKPGWRHWAEEFYGYPADEILSRRAILQQHVLDLGDEALALLEAVDLATRQVYNKFIIAQERNLHDRR